jgi:hypothetical protein
MVTSIHPIRQNGTEWVTMIDGTEYGRDALLARIKSMVRRNLPVEDEWSTFAILDRRQTEARWRKKDIVGHFHRNLPQYSR